MNSIGSNFAVVIKASYISIAAHSSFFVAMLPMATMMTVLPSLRRRPTLDASRISVASAVKLLVLLCSLRPPIARDGTNAIIVQAFSATLHATPSASAGRAGWHDEQGRCAAGQVGGRFSRHAKNILLVSCIPGVSVRHNHAVSMTNRDDVTNDDDEQDDPESDAIVFGEAGLLVALSVVATTLGVAALYSLSTNPLVDFDVDLYLSINRALNASGGGMGSGGVGDGIVGAGGEIVELPALSPAEQIVGAFFGPPRR